MTRTSRGSEKKPPTRQESEPRASPSVTLAYVDDRDRQFNLVRWSGERDQLAMERQAAGAGSVRQREIEALLEMIDAVRADLEVRMVSATRLTTLERCLAQLRLANQRRAMVPPPPRREFDAMSKILGSFLLKAPCGAGIQEVRLHLRSLAEQGHDNILAVGVGVIVNGHPAPAVGLPKFTEGLARRAIRWRNTPEDHLRVLLDEQLAKRVKRLRRQLSVSPR